MKKHFLLSALLAGVLAGPSFSGEVLSEEELEEVAAQGVQTVYNEDDVDARQDNNNGSLQLTDEAQQDIENVVVDNAAQSAANASVNLLGNMDTVGDINASQEAEQYADNYVDYTDQLIDNDDDVDARQNNNSASVQIVDEAQEFAESVAAVNSAQSATNLSLNALGNISSTGNIIASQEATQTSYNNVY